jgi:hypothetical protein
MKIEKIENVRFYEESYYKRYSDWWVTVRECGNIATVTFTPSANLRQTIKKIDANFYEVISTGEKLEFKKGESRIDDIASVRQSLSRLRDYLNTNVTDVSKCRWVTLTYAENMTDTNHLYRDFKAFNRKCRRHFGHYEYITAAEPQARGAWHLHCVFIFEEKAPFMENKAVSELWGKGFVNVRKLKGVDDIGRYLTAYLGDIPLDEVEQLPADAEIKIDRLKTVETTEGGEKKSKAIIKGARMALYPSGMNLYRISRGIKPPTVYKTKNINAEKKFEDWALTYEATYRITNETGGFVTTVNKRHYNRLRQKCDS